jgi:hypothetical protein
MRIDHPADWELVTAAGPDEPGKCTFADRRYQRLDVQWREVSYVPNFELILDRYRQQKDPKQRPSNLAGAPEPWRGLLRKFPDATLVHAGRFFGDAKWLVEATLLWPAERDVEVENAVLAAMCPQKGASQRLWQAMGLYVTMPADYTVRDYSSQAGRIRWDISAPGRRGAVVSVERIALVRHWLKSSVAEWLESELPEGSEVRARRNTDINGHRADVMISRVRRGTLSRLRGSMNVRLDIAWRCPVEERVYRISFTERRKDELISRPEQVEVACCGRAAATVQ